MDSGNDKIIIGRFGGAHGVKGLIKIISFTTPADNIVHYQPWWVKKQGCWIELTYKKVEQHHKQWVVQLEACTDRELAKAYTNCDIAISSDQLPVLDDNEFYWNELKGMTVINQEKINLGVVTDIFATGSNDVLVVRDEDKNERLIPYLLDVYVLKVDKQKKQVLVEWDADF